MEQRAENQMVSISCVIAAFNCEAIIEDSVLRLSDFLEQQTDSFEIIVVNDGSTDETATSLRRAKETCQLMKVITLESNRGKGGAIREGVLAASGDVIFFVDDDLNVEVESMAKVLEAVLVEKFDLAIGNRLSKESHSLESATPSRRLGSVVFNLLIRSLLLPDCQDSQCPMKVFTRPVARDLFRNQIISSFGFDVEILYKAKKHQYRLAKIPVVWRDGRLSVGPYQSLKVFSRAVYDAIRVRFYYRNLKFGEVSEK